MKTTNVIRLLFAAMLSILGAAHTFAQSINLSKIDTSVRLHADTSLIITVPDGIQEVTIANPRIADFSVVSDTSLYLIGKLPGLTSLTFLSDSGAHLKTIEVKVEIDVRELRARLREVLPKDKLRVMPANQGVILSGTVSSSKKLKLAMEIAEQFFPGKVSNAITLHTAVKHRFSLNVIKLSEPQIASLKSKNQLFEEPRSSASAKSQDLSQFTLLMDISKKQKFISDHQIPTINQQTLTISSAKAQTAFFGQAFDAPVLTKGSQITISQLRSGLFVTSKINAQANNLVELQLKVESATPQAVSAKPRGFTTFLIERQSVSHKMALNKGFITLLEIGGPSETLQRVHSIFDFYVNTLVQPKSKPRNDVRYFLVFDGTASG
jgi:Flp pilus assembly secretin CpaC